MKKKCVLAYSGGLDTSVILGWLIEQGYDVVAVYVDLGQPCEDRQATLEKARTCGAVEALLVDVREELCRDFAFPTMQWQARYEGTYLLGTSIARPLISKVCVEIAHREGCTVFAHGATGKGNDQCRFQLAAEALDPTIEVLAPWRIAEFRKRFPGRKELIEFCEAKNIPVKASKAKPYSSDENCLHTSYEAGLLEELSTDGFALVEFGMTVSPQAAPDEPETVAIEFAAGVPVAVNGRRLAAHEVVLALNEIGGRHGIGRTDIVENRLVGMKSRSRSTAISCTSVTGSRPRSPRRSTTASGIARRWTPCWPSSARSNGRSAAASSSTSTRATCSSRAGRASRACTMRRSPRWRPVAPTTRPTPRDSCGFSAFPCGCREE